MKETFHQADARFYEAWKYIEVKSGLDYRKYKF